MTWMVLSAAAQDSSHNAVAPTVSVIQGSLESLLQPPQLSEPASLAAPSPLPPHVWKASTAASMLTGVPLPSSAVMSPKVSAPSVIGNDASAPAPGSVHATLAPSTAPHSQPLPSAESRYLPGLHMHGVPLSFGQSRPCIKLDRPVFLSFIFILLMHVRLEL